mgnify:CR=1 FL=1
MLIQRSNTRKLSFNMALREPRTPRGILLLSKNLDFENAPAFVKQAYEALISVAQTCPGLKLPYRTNFVLDEFANMPALKDVGTMITASRSRNIRFTFIIQSFAQLNDVYGKDQGETIRSNCGNLIYLLTTELAALEEISKLLNALASGLKVVDDAVKGSKLSSDLTVENLRESKAIIELMNKSLVVVDNKLNNIVQMIERLEKEDGKEKE